MKSVICAVEKTKIVRWRFPQFSKISRRNRTKSVAIVHWRNCGAIVARQGQRYCFQDFLFQDNPEWHVEFSRTEKIVEYELTTFERNQSYPYIRYYIILRRKPQFYVFNLIFPNFVICFASIMGMFSPQSSSGDRVERVTLGITTLLSMAVIMMVISSLVPVTASVPVLSEFQ